MSWLYLVPILPLAGALVLAVFGGLMPRRAALRQAQDRPAINRGRPERSRGAAGAIGCASAGLSWAIGLKVAWAYWSAPPAGGVFHQTLYEWINVGTLRAPLGLYLDPLSLVMMAVVTFVSFVIHLYAAEFMFREEGYSRFFCYMNLFVGSMLVLVLADNLLLLYLGWEGVGLCSYLLIGFWYRERANGIAAQKAFIVTRIGDAVLAVGIFLLFSRLGTLDIREAMMSLAAGGPGVSTLATVAALLVLGGAVAKSAQLPLQTWLPDAMAGPTPVSALIHAATMVTAGVYLIARLHVMFSLSPGVMLLVAVIGAATACYGGFSALAQRDIKRVLAYSTISQIGFMFIALGVGAWWATIFHFMTHAAFKALLFLSAGMVVQALGEERDMSRMGGLFRRLPVAAWTFLIGACSLSALPLVTAGFYSKDAILWASRAYPLGSAALWGAGMLAALLTSIYIFRAFFLVFLGELRTVPQEPRGRHPLQTLAVVTLSVFAIIAGFVSMPRGLGGFDPFGKFLAAAFGSPPRALVSGEMIFLVWAGLASVVGVVLAYAWFRPGAAALAVARAPVYDAARRFLLAGWGFDWLYDRLFVRPYLFVTRINQADFVDWFFTGLALAAGGANRALSATQSGRVRNYATALLLGAVLVVAILLLR